MSICAWRAQIGYFDHWKVRCKFDVRMWLMLETREILKDRQTLSTADAERKRRLFSIGL